VVEELQRGATRPTSVTLALFLVIIVPIIHGRVTTIAVEVRTLSVFTQVVVALTDANLVILLVTIAMKLGIVVNIPRALKNRYSVVGTKYAKIVLRSVRVVLRPSRVAEMRPCATTEYANSRAFRNTPRVLAIRSVAVTAP